MGQNSSGNRTALASATRPDQVRELFKRWSRSDVTKLQGKVCSLNWVGVEDDTAPLSESESEETSDSL